MTATAAAAPQAKSGGTIAIRELHKGWQLTVTPDGHRPVERKLSTFAAACTAAADVRYAPGASPGMWSVRLDFLDGAS